MRALVKLIVWALGLAAVVIIISKLALPPSYAVTTDIQVRASPDRVWERVGDLSKWMSWVRGLERFDLVNGSGREVGSVAHARVYTGIRNIDLNVQVVEAIPERRLRYRMIGGPQDGVASSIEVQAIDDGRATRVRWTESHAPGGWWGNLVAAGLKSVVTTHHEESLNRLKFSIERGL